MTAGYRGGCRPRLAGCRPSCGHRQIVEAYRAARAADELRVEAQSYGYATEAADYPPCLTFRDFLKGMRR